MGKVGGKMTFRLNEDDSVDLMLIQFHFLSFLKLFIRTAPKFTSQATRSVVYTKSILMVWENLKSSVIRHQLVEDGRCFKRDITVQQIFSAAGMTTNRASAI